MQYTAHTMKKIFPALLLLFIGINASAQTTVTITNRIRHKPKSLSVIEKYQSLKSDKTVKHGLYQRFTNNMRLLESGYYNQGKKDSVWIQYNNWNQFPEITGQYKNDKKVGIWTYYKEKDTVEFLYDFDNNKVSGITSDTSKEYQVLIGTDTVKTKLAQPPLYLGGKSTIQKTLVDNVNYPNEARENNIQGRVLVAFTIMPDGQASAPWIMRGIHPSIDKEALRALAHLPALWSAAIYKGQPVTSIYVVPVIFHLE